MVELSRSAAGGAGLGRVAGSIRNSTLDEGAFFRQTSLCRGAFLNPQSSQLIAVNRHKKEKA